jgi:hypothetical protein
VPKETGPRKRVPRDLHERGPFHRAADPCSVEARRQTVESPPRPAGAIRGARAERCNERADKIAKPACDGTSDERTMRGAQLAENYAHDEKRQTR